MQLKASMMLEANNIVGFFKAGLNKCGYFKAGQTSKRMYLLALKAAEEIEVSEWTGKLAKVEKTIKTQIAGVKEDITDVKKEITDVNTKVNTQIADVKMEIAGQIADVKEEIADANTKIDDVKKEIADVSTKIDDLKDLFINYTESEF